MEIYEHVLDANEPYENWFTSVFTMEPITVSDFEEVIDKAQEALIEEWGYKGDWNDVARKIVEIDDRFFFPERGRMAIIEDEEDVEVIK